MNKDQLVLLILQKQEEIEEIEAKIKDRNGCAIIAKIICRDNQSAEHVQQLLLNTIQTSEDVLNSVVNIVDESR